VQQPRHAQVRELGGQLGLAERRVQRRRHRPAADDGEERHDQRGPVGRRERHPVTFPHAKRPQPPRRPVDRELQPRVRHHVPGLGRKRRMVIGPRDELTQAAGGHMRLLSTTRADISTQYPTPRAQATPAERQ
jgi:hypothetical protein